MAGTYLAWTPSGAGSTTKWTTSFWVKRANLGGTQELVANWSSGTDNTTVRFLSGDTLDIVDYQSNSIVMRRATNRVFRDTSAWYHIVVNIDTDQATADDRTKLYINGVQETSFSTTTNYSSSQAHKWNTTYVHNIGQSGNDAGEFDGSMSHIHMVDGTAYDASAFGSVDSDTGEWKINTSPSVSYGTNGFFILKDGNSVTDQSGNGNNFTVLQGTLTNTESSPSNVFATLNNLDGYVSHMVFSHGNNTVDNGSTATNKSYTRSTLGMTSGKYYFEAKNITNANWQTIGITDRASGGVDGELGGSSADYVYRNGDGQKGNNNSFYSYGDTYGVNDIIGCAVDLDNNKIYFSKNGVWQNSGDPTSGATGTGAAYTITASSSTSTGFYFFAVGDTTAANSSKWSANFGNGYFGTTAVSSAGTNASGIGIFEYDVPTGYTALSTKGLNL